MTKRHTTTAKTLGFSILCRTGWGFFYMSVLRHLLSHNPSTGTIPTQTNSVSLVGKYCFNSNSQLHLLADTTPQWQQWTFYLQSASNLYSFVSLHPLLPCLVFKLWQLDTSVRIRSQEMIVLFHQHNHWVHSCPFDCTNADNWFKKIFFLLCLQSLEYDAISYLFSTTSPVTFKHFLQTFLAFFFVQIELNENGCRGDSFLGNEDSVCLLL